jgi:hypothetical protein
MDHLVPDRHACRSAVIDDLFGSDFVATPMHLLQQQTVYTCSFDYIGPQCPTRSKRRDRQGTIGCNNGLQEAPSALIHGAVSVALHLPSHLSKGNGPVRVHKSPQQTNMLEVLLLGEAQIFVFGRKVREHRLTDASATLVHKSAPCTSTARSIRTLRTLLRVTLTTRLRPLFLPLQPPLANLLGPWW